MLRLTHLIRQANRPLCLRTSGQQHLQQQQVLLQTRYWYSEKGQLTDGEKAIMEKLKFKFPSAKTVDVSDISGGCGAMYQISIEAEEFRGKRTVQQHRLVNEALAEEIKSMHGLQINTKVPTET